MSKYFRWLVVGIILSVISFIPHQLGELAGHMGMYTGTLNFHYSGGDNPINKIVFLFEENLGASLMVYDEPQGWDCIHHGDSIELYDGTLYPGESVQVIMSCKWFMWEGIYRHTAIVTTATGETRSVPFDFTFPDMMVLQIFFHLTNPLVCLVVFGATGALLLAQVFLSNSNENEDNN